MDVETYFERAPVAGREVKGRKPFGGMLARPGESAGEETMASNNPSDPTSETIQMIDERFESLETKVLYQDRTIEELNTVVTKQQDQIDELLAETKRLRESIESGAESGIEGGEEPPPPHY